MEDQFLIRQVLGGNTSAFRMIVLRYQKPLFCYLRSFKLAEAQVEEIAQDVFLRVYKNLHEYDCEKSQFNTWLFVIAKNCALNLMAKHSHQKETLSESEVDVVHDETPLSSLEQVTLKKNLNQCIRKLPTHFQNAVTLFHLNELSLEEVADVEECSVGTVKSRIHLAKIMLKEIILKNYGSESL